MLLEFDIDYGPGVSRGRPRSAAQESAVAGLRYIVAEIQTSRRLTVRPDLLCLRASRVLPEEGSPPPSSTRDIFLRPPNLF